MLKIKLKIHQANDKEKRKEKKNEHKSTCMCEYFVLEQCINAPVHLKMFCMSYLRKELADGVIITSSVVDYHY